MFNSQLSIELDRITAMEEYHRTKLLYYKNRRQQLEREIESDVQEEFEQIAAEAWGDDAN